MYKRLQDAISKGDIRADEVGRRIVLPSSYTGGRRYKLQNYHDAMTICGELGYPDLFITFTCNSKWPKFIEYQEMIDMHGGEARPDSIVRLFHIKLYLILDELKKIRMFGCIIGCKYYYIILFNLCF